MLITQFDSQICFYPVKICQISVAVSQQLLHGSEETLIKPENIVYHIHSN